VGKVLLWFYMIPQGLARLILVPVSAGVTIVGLLIGNLFFPCVLSLGDFLFLSFVIYPVLVICNGLCRVYALFFFSGYMGWSDKELERRLRS
jgi:hypothetical protein